eukprot:1923262-Rhodomonas_salina.1
MCIRDRATVIRGGFACPVLTYAVLQYRAGYHPMRLLHMPGTDVRCDDCCRMPYAPYAVCAGKCVLFYALACPLSYST